MNTTKIDQQEILKILPQVPPFVMIDRVVDFKKDESLTAIKNITGNEWVFENHQYPGDVFPETLIIEAAAQTAIIFANLNANEPFKKNLRFLLGKTKAEFFAPVHVGDQLQLKTMSNRLFSNRGYVGIEVSTKENKKAEISIFFSLQEREP